MDGVQIIVLNLTLSLMAFVFIAKWYVTPWLKSMSLDTALPSLSIALGIAQRNKDNKGVIFKPRKETDHVYK